MIHQIDIQRQPLAYNIKLLAKLLAFPAQRSFLLNFELDFSGWSKDLIAGISITYFISEFPPLSIHLFCPVLLNNSLFFMSSKNARFFRSSAQNTDRIDIHVTPFAPWGGKKIRKVFFSETREKREKIDSKFIMCPAAANAHKWYLPFELGVLLHHKRLA